MYHSQHGGRPLQDAILHGLEEAHRHGTKVLVQLPSVVAHTPREDGTASSQGRDMKLPRLYALGLEEGSQPALLLLAPLKLLYQAADLLHHPYTDKDERRQGWMS